MSIRKALSHLGRRSFRSDTSGATTIEYCLLAVMIAMALIAAATIWGDRAKAMYENLATSGWGSSGGGG